MKPSNDREAITLIVQGLVDAGFTITKVHDGEEVYVTSDVAEAVEHVTDVDMAHVFFRTPNGERGWVWFVQGNDPEEVAADYTVNMDPELDAIVSPWWV